MRGPGRKKLPAVQVGDPFTEKVLIECCLDLYAAKLVVGIQDLGGAGLSCATSELAAAGDGGMHIDLDQVPMRATGMTAAEILSSESQERMCAVVTPENVDAFMEVCHKWDVLATVIGEVTDGDRLIITWHGETVVDVPPRTVAHEGPVYERPVQRPASQDALVADTPDRLARPDSPDELHATLLDDGRAPGAVQPQVDHRAVRPLRARQHRPRRARRRRRHPHRREDRPRHRARHRRVRPLHRARPVRRRAARARRGVPQRRRHRRRPRRPSATASTSARPRTRRVMWQFQQAVRGLADGCAKLGIPVTGGNVSFYNQTGTTAILPTPVVGVLGVIDDVHRRIPTGLGLEPGETLILLGDTADEFDGSIWSQVEHDHLGGVPPKVDLAREQLLADILLAGSRDGLVSAAHDLSEGGLAQAVVEAALAGETGCRILLPDGASGATGNSARASERREIRQGAQRSDGESAGASGATGESAGASGATGNSPRASGATGESTQRDPFVMLFSESAGRVLVSVPRTEETRFTAMCSAREMPWVRIGVVDQGSDSRRGPGPVRGDTGRTRQCLGIGFARPIFGAPPPGRQPRAERTDAADTTLRARPRLAYAFDAVMARHPLLGVGVGPAQARLHRHRVRRVLLLLVDDAVAVAARLVLPGIVSGSRPPRLRRRRGDRLRSSIAAT